MKRFLLPHLICPACLPSEQRLTVSVDRENGDDIVKGRLTCQKCRKQFPVRDGVANLLPEPDQGPSGGQWRYEEGGTVDRYLWSHFADLVQPPANGAANSAWEECLSGGDGAGLDAGCSVGRLTYAMAGRLSWAVGCDLSGAFIKTARKLARERRLTFSLPSEGNLREDFTVELPASWRSDNVEFIVADALRLPFSRGTFGQTTSLNLLDRVSYPLAHLYEMNRVAQEKGADFLVASPFCWVASSAAEERWLGGRTSGEYSGSGEENVRLLLQGKGGIIAPPWRIERSGVVEWKMRSHRNHHELISSRYLLARR